MTDPAAPAILNQADYTLVHADIVALLEAARRTAARSVNAVMTATYWAVARRIVEGEQGGQERAAYGEALIVRLSADLAARFGRGFSRQNLQQMRQFYLAWPPEKISLVSSAKSSGTPIRQTLSGESSYRLTISQTASGQSPDLLALAQAFPLPWSAYVRLLSVKNPQARAFYETEALRGGWTIAQLNHQIGSQFYERTALSTSKAAMLEQGAVAEPGENPPVGLILCAEKGAAEAHYALEGLPNKVLAAEYQTVLPDEKLLAEELDKTRRELETRWIGNGKNAQSGE